MKYLVRITDLANHADYAIFEATPKEMNVFTVAFDLLNHSALRLKRSPTSRFYLQLQAWDGNVLFKEIPAFISDEDMMVVLFPMLKDRQDLAPLVRKKIDVYS